MEWQRYVKTCRRQFLMHIWLHTFDCLLKRRNRNSSRTFRLLGFVVLALTAVYLVNKQMDIHIFVSLPTSCHSQYKTHMYRCTPSPYHTYMARQRNRENVSLRYLGHLRRPIAVLYRNTCEVSAMTFYTN